MSNETYKQTIKLQLYKPKKETGNEIMDILVCSGSNAEPFCQINWIFPYVMDVFAVCTRAHFFYAMFVY